MCACRCVRACVCVCETKSKPPMSYRFHHTLAGILTPRQSQRVASGSSHSKEPTDNGLRKRPVLLTKSTEQIKARETHWNKSTQLNPPACMHGRIHHTEPVNIKPQLIKSAQEVSSVQAQSCNTLNTLSVGNKMAIYCASVSVSQYVAFFLYQHVHAGRERGGELFIPSVLDARSHAVLGAPDVEYHMLHCMATIDTSGSSYIVQSHQ